MALRIAFDLDGVLADMESELGRQAEMLFGETMAQRLRERAAGAAAPPDAADASDEPPTGNLAGTLIDEPPVRTLKMTPRQQRRLWRHVEAIEDFWLTLSEMEPGIVERVAMLAAERRWEVIFLTKRPQTAGATAQVQTQRWLEAHGFPLPSVYVVQGSRGKIAAALDLDIIVDDRPENCLDVVVDSKARAILVWRGGQPQLPAAARRLGIGVVQSIAECLDVLTQIDTPASEQIGMKERVMRLLGLKALPAQV